MPSTTSGPEKPMNSMAREASKVGPAMRSQLLSACLVQRTAAGGMSRSFSAAASAVSTTLPSSATIETRPMRSASSPESASHSSR